MYGICCVNGNEGFSCSSLGKSFLALADILVKVNHLKRLEFGL